MKISKIDSRNHEIAKKLALSGKSLSFDDKYFILENYNAAATNLISKNAAYFTPPLIAREMTLECYDEPDKRVLDLGAGIGCLSFFVYQKAKWWSRKNNIEIICIEQNPEYIEIGKTIVPEATWICGDIFDEELIKSLGRFDEVISNPPYGIFPRTDWLYNYQSQFMVAEVAMKVSDHGVFLLAQADCPFQYSGKKMYMEKTCTKYERFHKKTGIFFHMNCGIDLDPTKCDDYIFKNLNKNMLFEIVIVSKDEEL